MANNDEYTDEYNDEYLRRDFLSVSIFGRGYHSRYQNFEFTCIYARQLKLFMQVSSRPYALFIVRGPTDSI